MPPILPTPYPIPTPDPLAPTIDAGVLWTFDSFAPAISMSQSVWLWLNQYGMLKYAMILAIISRVIRWMLHFVASHGQSQGSADI